MSIDQPKTDTIVRGEPVSGGPVDWPRPVEIVGRFVSVGPLEPSRDAADLYAPTHGEGRERRFAYLFDSPFESEAAMVDALAVAAAATETATFAIRDLATARTVGRAGLMRADPRHRTVEVGSILFSPALSRSAGASESMFLLMRHAFDTLRYLRYEWKCDALNAPSRSAALRFGFRHEGVFLKHMIIKGHSRDTAWYAITDDEWPVVRAAFEAWLAAENFDGEGRQIRRLSDIRAEIAASGSQYRPTS